MEEKKESRRKKFQPKKRSRRSLEDFSSKAAKNACQPTRRMGNSELLLSARTLRITRVGTHAVSEGSKSTLWQRLKTHKGNEDGSGNHRGSIFRCHVGEALMQRSRESVPSWGEGGVGTASMRLAEAGIEQKVSAYLGQLLLLWLDISGPPSKFSDRAYLEQNLIALLSGSTGPLDIPDETWLGYHSPNPSVRRSGLWNVNYTDFEYDCHFLEVFDFYVQVTLGRKKAPAGPLAPSTWYQAVESGYRQGFLDITTPTRTNK